jgi:hypothetical protein
VWLVSPSASAITGGWCPSRRSWSARRSTRTRARNGFPAA